MLEVVALSVSEDLTIDAIQHVSGDEGPEKLQGKAEKDRGRRQEGWFHTSSAHAVGAHMTSHMTLMRCGYVI